MLLVAVPVPVRRSSNTGHFKYRYKTTFSPGKYYQYGHFFAFALHFFMILEIVVRHIQGDEESRMQSAMLKNALLKEPVVSRV